MLPWLLSISSRQHKTFLVDQTVLLLAYRVIHGHGPSYLAKLLKPHEPSRQLRSADKNLLVVPRTKSSSYGDRAFSCAVPRLWNALPDTMRKIPTEYTFKKCLKTMLFKQAYDL